MRDQVHSFYKKLFISDAQVVSNRVERVVVILLIKKKVLATNNKNLIREPTNIEIDKVSWASTIRSHLVWMGLL